jgi:hypothetical protein
MIRLYDRLLPHLFVSKLSLFLPAFVADLLVELTDLLIDGKPTLQGSADKLTA